MDAGLHARSGPARLSFGPFAIDVDRVEITRDGAPLALRPKTFAMLAYLVQNAGRLVSKDELMAAVWPDLVVSDESLAKCISEVRAALDDREQRLVKTVPRRGYLFDTPVTADPAAAIAHAAGSPPPDTAPAAPARWRMPRASHIAS